MTQPQILTHGHWTKVTPEVAGWHYVSFEVISFTGQTLDLPSDGDERAIIPLGGTANAVIDGRSYDFGGRADVFSGLGHLLYVPRDTAVTLTASEGAEIAIASAPATTRHEVVLVTPDDLPVEARGGGNASRQVSTLMPPSFSADRLHIVEVWTPGGNWSSFPPHKHEHDHAGEAELEETYYYRLRDPENGWALQRAYSPEREFDFAQTVRDGDICLLPWAYHTTVAAHGHDLYYLNVLAGPAPERTLQAYQDPTLASLAEDWAQQGIDGRLPVVPAHPQN